MLAWARSGRDRSDGPRRGLDLGSVGIVVSAALNHSGPLLVVEGRSKKRGEARPVIVFG